MSVPVVKLNDGNLMPVLGFGTVRLKKEPIQHAINCGYRHFDSAFLYRTEKAVGEAVNEAIYNGKVKREDIFFVTKVWPTYYSKGRVIKSAQKSIKESGLKYLDLLLLHWPLVFKDTDDTDTDKLLYCGNIAFSDYDLMDVYRELEEVKRMGLAKSIGVSNFNSEQIERIVKIAEFLPVTNQVECHPYLNQEKLIKFCAQRNIRITAYSPLGTRDYVAGKASLFDEKALQTIAKKYSKSVAQIILRWQTQRGVVVETKARIEENIDIFGFALSDEDMSAINSLNRNLRYIDGKLWGLERHKEYPFNIEF